MLNAITTKIEIDVMQSNEIDSVCQLAAAHNMPAIVVHPQLITQAISVRARRQGRFDIFTTVDWPKGETFGMTKLRGLCQEAMSVDGYEIMLTGGRTALENLDEVKKLTGFIRSFISQHAQIRLILGALSRPAEEVVRLATAVRDAAASVMLRTDNHLRAQTTKASTKAHGDTTAAIRAACGMPIKLSGNIDSVKTVAECLKLPAPPVVFAASLQQAQQIVTNLAQKPAESRELLAAR